MSPCRSQDAADLCLRIISQHQRLVVLCITFKSMWLWPGCGAYFCNDIYQWFWWWYASEACISLSFSKEVETSADCYCC